MKKVFPVQPGLRDNNDLHVGRKLATFQLFFQSGRAKDLSAPLCSCHIWPRTKFSHMSLSLLSPSVSPSLATIRLTSSTNLFFKSSLTSCSLWFTFQIPALRSSPIPGNLLTCPSHRNPIAPITSIRETADSSKKLVGFYETARYNIPRNSYRLGLGCWMRLV